MNYFSRIARAGFPWSLAAVVFIAGCGESTPPPPVTQEAAKRTPEQEFAATLKKAEAGDAEAQSQLGEMYIWGKGVPKDAVKAAEWFQKAAEQGDSGAQTMLGWHYRNETNDSVTAAMWFQKAAAQGNPYAQFNLGNLYLKGEGVAKDAAKAADWFRQAAEQGHANAQFNLAKCYYSGAGVPKNHQKGFEWLQKSAEQGGAQAQLDLGLWYAQGIGVPKDPKQAVEWWHKSAAQGNALAQAHLGYSYANGNGVLKDSVLAYAWFNLAAASGIDSAIKNRGIVEGGLSKIEFEEAQRLSSSWKTGQILVREGRAATGATTPSSPGALSKQGTGTAFIVGKTGHAITNHHVIAGCKELRAEGRDGVVKLITNDAVNDIALLEVPGAVSASAVINADPAKLRQGEDIVVFGFPLNAVLSSGGNLTPGVVSALTGLGNNTNQIQITAPIQPGSSGSPVLNKKGEVVGVVSMKLSDSKMAKATGQIGQNVNFAVSGQTLKSFLDAHQVDYRKSGFLSFDKSTADLADEAKKWTMVVECWK